METNPLSSKQKMLIAVAALGYFVDVYDLILFSVVRNPSLKSLGLSGSELLDQGLNLMNIQMGGMLIGGIWVLKVKIGRPLNPCYSAPFLCIPSRMH